MNFRLLDVDVLSLEDFKKIVDYYGESGVISLFKTFDIKMLKGLAVKNNTDWIRIDLTSKTIKYNEIKPGKNTILWVAPIIHFKTEYPDNKLTVDGSSLDYKFLYFPILNNSNIKTAILTGRDNKIEIRMYDVIIPSLLPILLKDD